MKIVDFDIAKGFAQAVMKKEVHNNETLFPSLVCSLKYKYLFPAVLLLFGLSTVLFGNGDENVELTTSFTIHLAISFESFPSPSLMIEFKSSLQYIFISRFCMISPSFPGGTDFF